MMIWANGCVLLWKISMIDTIKKPWGYEYLLFQNENVAIWHLFINAYQQTSLHSHPNKKTGLVILDGAAKVSFLGSDVKLFYGEKIMIRHGVFHKTQSMTPHTLQLLEIETPVDKEDIIRLDDAYGRTGLTTMGDLGLLVEPLNINKCSVGKCNISYLTLTSSSLYNPDIFDNFMITSGSILYMGSEVAGPGDIISYNNLKKLADTFRLPNDMEGIAIKIC